jgi:hypothetical protein
MKYQLLLVKDLKYMSDDKYSNLLPEYERMGVVRHKFIKIGQNTPQLCWGVLHSLIGTCTQS